VAGRQGRGHILWSDPLRQFYSQQIGRAHGPDIAQLGKSDDGTDTRWSFTDITADSDRHSRAAGAIRHGINTGE
jgi:hypothetical protein